MNLPVKNNEREIFMDVLRGFSILGIFIANLHAFSWYDMAPPGASGPYLLPLADGKMLFLQHLFIEGKFYSIFSFLFGWGVALQLSRTEAKGKNAVGFVRRRLTVMLILGAFHLLLWPGDIVFFYALLGFILLPLRKLSNKALIISAIVLILSPIALYSLKMMFPVFRYPTEALYNAGMWADQKLIGVNSDESFRAYIRDAGWYQILLGDISGFFFRYGDLFFQSRIPKVLGMMLLGLVVGRTDFYKQLFKYKRLLYMLLIIGIVIALPANYMLAEYMQLHDGSYNGYQSKGLFRTIAYALGVAPLAVAYIASFMLIFQTRAGKKILSLLAPAGKMAFTNYVMQTLIGNAVFLNAGLGYMAKVGPVYYTLFALLVFGCQVLFSTAWLKYYNYGPLEWIWRSATYGSWQPLRRLPQPVISDFRN